MSGAPRNLDLFKTFTLLPTSGAPALSVAWTLVYEVAFYSAFAFRYASRGRAAWIALALSLVGYSLGVRWHVLTSEPPPVLAGLFELIASPLNLEFVAGILAAKSVVTVRPSFWPVYLLSAIGLWAIFVARGAQDADRVIWATGTAFAVVVLVWAELHHQFRVLAALVSLGNISYALYLVHSPVVSLVARVYRRTGITGSWSGGFIVAMAVAVTLGFAYNVIERWMLTRAGYKRLRLATE